MQKLKTLVEMAALINSTLDPHVITLRAIEATTRLMGAETGSLLLVDRERNELYFEVALGEQGEKLKEVRLRMGEGIAGWVALHAKPVCIPDVEADIRFFHTADRLNHFVTRSILAVPLVHSGRVLGVLQAINKVEGEFTDEDLELLVSLANQVAPAVENAFLYHELRETFHSTTMALAEALAMRDAYTGGHTRRVEEYCLAMGMRLGLDGRELENLKLAAILHDIGKIGIPDTILMKQAPLNTEEQAQMNTHSELGAEILRHVKALGEVVPGVLSHHERLDGAGYPQGLVGEEISLYARIIAVADTYDAMTTDRPYRKALPHHIAMSELRKCSGKEFDPEVVDAFLADYGWMEEIFNRSRAQEVPGEAPLGADGSLIAPPSVQ